MKATFRTSIAIISLSLTALTSVIDASATGVSRPLVIFAAAATTPDLAEVEQTAKSAQTRIQRSKAEMKALIAAAKANDTAAAKALLVRNGFSEKQLEGARIVLIDRTPGGGETERKVKITVTCCPLTITIEF